jgi:ABC-type branched-subunit amino acid transport system substrate-binding protein
MTTLDGSQEERFMRRIGLIFLVAVILGATDAWAAAPAAPSREPGVTASSIKIGGILDQTGHGTLVSKPILAGYDLAITEANATGGINGRKIDYSAANDNYDPSQTLSKAKDLVEGQNVFAILGIFGSDDAAVAAPYLQRQQVPFFDPIGGGVNLGNDPWIWQTEPDYGREGRVIARYAATTLHAKRVAVVYQVGVGEKQVAAIRATLPRFHAAMVGTASYNSTDSNLQGQVIRIRSDNPDLVVLNGTPTPTAAFLQYARLLNFSPKDGYIANYPMSDPLWLALTGANSEGDYVCSYADLTGNNGVAKKYRAAITKYNGEAYSNYGLYGYFNASLFLKALKLVGKNLTRKRLQQVLDTKFRHYKTGFTGNLNWTPTQHYGARQFKMYKIHNHQFVPVTGWLNP